MLAGPKKAALHTSNVAISKRQCKTIHGEIHYSKRIYFYAEEKIQRSNSRSSTFQFLWLLGRSEH